MKYIDFTVQTTLILVGLSLLIGTYNESTWTIALLAFQLFVGIWQMSSSIISVALKMRMAKLKQYHLFIATVYLCVFTYAAPVFNLWAMLPAWILGIYYYVITWMKTFPRQRRNGSFLPHLSF